MAERHQLTATDSSMLFMESGGNPNHIAPLIICDQSTIPGGQPLRLRQIKAKMEDALNGAPNFRRKLVRPPLGMGEPYWVDDEEFDVDFHLRHLGLPKPGDWRQLSIQVARLLARPLDMSRPLWEMYVIEGLDRVDKVPEGGFAILLKIHHAMLDGMGALTLMNGMFDNEPLPPPEPAPSTWRALPGPTPMEMFARNYVQSVTRPARMASQVGGLIRNRRRGEKPEPPIKPGGIAPKTPFNGLVDPSRVYDWRWYLLAEVKGLRALAPGSTVNDVALAIVTSALRRYLSAKKALPEANLVITVPFSIRSEATKDKPAGNEITMINVPVPTTVADPLERFRLIAAQMAFRKQAENMMSIKAITEITSQLPGRLMGLLGQATGLIANRTGRSLIANTLVTNVPGMTTPMYFCGARIINIGGGGPVLNGMGLAHLIGSYCEWFNVNVVACRTMLPDIDFYMQCIDEGLAEYLDLLAKQPPAEAQPKAPRQTGGKKAPARQAKSTA
ncbi:MAG: wax ester/triacylglycerol synthase family O-acyltransferase [Rhizorhabdus sp.]